MWGHSFQENYGFLELQYKALNTVISLWLFITLSSILTCMHQNLLFYTTRRLILILHFPYTVCQRIINFGICALYWFNAVSIVSCCCGADAGIKLILLTAEMKPCVCCRALVEVNEYSKTHLTSKLRKKTAAVWAEQRRAQVGIT